MKVYVGDTICALGYKFTIGKILYQDCFDGDWDVEFLDNYGGYHHWKSGFDGGFIIKGEQNEDF